MADNVDHSDRISIRARHTIRASTRPELVQHLSKISEANRVDELIALANKAVIAGLASSKFIIFPSNLSPIEQSGIDQTPGISSSSPSAGLNSNDDKRPRLSKEKVQAAFGVPRRGN